MGLLLLLIGSLSASAETIHRDRMVSGGEPASAAGPRISWAALGEPLGGRMSGTSFTIIDGDGGGFLGNAPPQMTAFSPADKTKVYMGATVTLSVTVTDPDGDPIRIRFLIDGQVFQDWSSAKTVTWDTANAPFGWRQVRVEVTDGKQTVAKESRCFVFWRPPL